MTELKILKPWIRRYLTDHLIDGSVDLLEEQITILKKLDATALTNYIVQKSPRTIKQLCSELEELLPVGSLNTSPDNQASSIKKKKKDSRKLKKQSLQNLEEIKIEEESSISQDEESSVPAVVFCASRSKENCSPHVRKQKSLKSSFNHVANSHESSHNREEIESSRVLESSSQQSPDLTFNQNETPLREVSASTLQVKPLHKLVRSPILADLNLSESPLSTHTQTITPTVNISAEIVNHTHEFAHAHREKKKHKKKRKESSHTIVDISANVGEPSQGGSGSIANLRSSQKSVESSSSTNRIVPEPITQVPITSFESASDTQIKPVVLREIFLNFVNFMGSLSGESKRKIEEEILRAIEASAKKLQIPNEPSEEVSANQSPRKKSKKKKKIRGDDKGIEYDVDISIEEIIKEENNIESTKDSLRKNKRKYDNQFSNGVQDASFGCDISMEENSRKKFKNSRGSQTMEDLPFVESIDLTDQVSNEIISAERSKKKKKKKKKNKDPSDVSFTLTTETEDISVQIRGIESAEACPVEGLEEDRYLDIGVEMISEQPPEVLNAEILDIAQRPKKKKKSRQKQNITENNEMFLENQTHSPSNNIHELQSELIPNISVGTQSTSPKASCQSEDKPFNPRLYDFENLISESVITRRRNSQERLDIPNATAAKSPPEPSVSVTSRPCSSQQLGFAGFAPFADQRLRGGIFDEQYSSGYSESSEDSSVEVTYHFMKDEVVNVKTEIVDEAESANRYDSTLVENSAEPSCVASVNCAPALTPSHFTEQNFDVSSHGQVKVSETSSGNPATVINIELGSRKSSAPIESISVDENQIKVNLPSVSTSTVISEEPSETVRVVQTIGSSSNVTEENEFRSLEKELLELEHTLYLAEKGDQETRPRTKPVTSKDSAASNTPHSSSSPRDENSSPTTTSVDGVKRKGSHRCEKCKDKLVVFDHRRDLISHWLDHVKETVSKIQSASPSETVSKIQSASASASPSPSSTTNDKSLQENLPTDRGSEKLLTQIADGESNQPAAHRVIEQVLPHVKNQGKLQIPGQLSSRLNKRVAIPTTKRITSQAKTQVTKSSAPHPQQSAQSGNNISVQYSNKPVPLSQQSRQQSNDQNVKNDSGKTVLQKNLPDVCPDSALQNLGSSSKPSSTSTHDSTTVPLKTPTTASAIASTSSPLKCKLCSTVMKNEPALKAHLAKHSKPFKCSLCNASFKTDATLKSHLVTHSNHKPFKCSQCSTGFKRKGDLNHHRAVLHSVRRFHCKPCKLSFKFKQSLSKHMKERHPS